MALYFGAPGGGAYFALTNTLYFSASGGGKSGPARRKRLQRGRDNMLVLSPEPLRAKPDRNKIKTAQRDRKRDRQ
jgi:hypothetical protein